jgi:hypothetical protein
MSETIQRRTRRSRDEWQRLIKEQADSGLTQSAFCEANAIGLASFQNWKRRLGAEAPAEPWFELGALSRSPSSGWDIELELGDGICLRLRRC